MFHSVFQFFLGALGSGSLDQCRPALSPGAHQERCVHVHRVSHSFPFEWLDWEGFAARCPELWTHLTATVFNQIDGLLDFFAKRKRRGLYAVSNSLDGLLQTSKNREFLIDIPPIIRTCEVTLNAMVLW